MTEKSFRIWTGALGLGAFVVLMIIDVATESEPIPLTELLADAVQLALIVASATGVALLTNSFQRDRLEKETLIQDLRMARAEGAAWRERAESYLSGLSVEIEQQFEDWQLTDAEREVGLLMLKGFAHGAQLGAGSGRRPSGQPQLRGRKSRSPRTAPGGPQPRAAVAKSG